MKKIFSVLLTVILCIALSGCSCSKKSKESSPQQDSQTGSEQEVGSEYIWD